MKSIVSTVAALICALMILGETASAQSRDEKYVVIGTTSKTVGYMAPWVGKIKGFFLAEGVRVDIPILRSATTGVQALVGGSTQFDATTVDAMISAVDKGQELEVIGGIIKRSNLQACRHQKVSKLHRPQRGDHRCFQPHFRLDGAAPAHVGKKRFELSARLHALVHRRHT